MASVSEKNGHFSFFSELEPNVTVFAIPLFRTEVGRSADERRWPNAQRKPLNVTKNTERPKNTEEYKVEYSGLAPLYRMNESINQYI